MKNQNCIIITNNTDEAEMLHKYLNKEFKREVRTTFHTGEQFYNQQWYWIFQSMNGKIELSGSSGHKALESTMQRHPDFGIKTLELFLGDNKVSLNERAKLSTKNVTQGAEQLIYSLAMEGILAEPYRSWITGAEPDKKSPEYTKYIKAIEETAGNILLFHEEIAEHGKVLGND
jgi:hypothetical protein